MQCKMCLPAVKYLSAFNNSTSNLQKHVLSQSEDAESDAESDRDSIDDEPTANYLDTFSILEQDNGLEYQLPTHQRCACHLLNLVAITDAEIAEKKMDTYKRLSRAAFGKCQAMWNNTGRSYMAAEVVEDHCRLQLIRPNQTRWNSTFMAVERIIRIIQEKGEEAIRNICEEFKLKTLTQAEIAFLTDYCSVMKPLVKALNILQSETNTHLGWLLPVICQLQAKLKRQETSSKMCLPLIKAIQDGVQKRFGVMMMDPELIAAAILLPKFKTTWTERPDVIETGLAYVRQHLDQMAEVEVEQVGQHSSDEDDFFSSIKSRRYRGVGRVPSLYPKRYGSAKLLSKFKKTLSETQHWPACFSCLRAAFQLCWITVHCKASKDELN
ncbi:uncharacterized protein LOC130110008 [Lampris incognitus]|uniref:uncharacterized protein LOC130110008 n=1 Tax=Lampris incognitus TaxID=2546036 RepID=UPI0024B4850B|nr:uncharacterized protein LOC130110008 [Lampris incognitus]